MFSEFFLKINDYECFSTALSALPDDERWRVIERMMVGIFRASFRDFDSKLHMFRICEQMGGHVLPVHFYSPVPNLSMLTAKDFEQVFDLGFSAADQLEFVRTVSEYGSELSDVPQCAEAGEVCWKNSAICEGDATLYYCLLRHFKPKLVLEVGSGYSTLFARRAGMGQLEAIEPYPFAWLQNTVDRLIELPVQDVPLSEFQRLQKNDVLFIDSTHVCKIGSDVNYLFLNVLPKLNPGVVVHVHDIFLPFEYPQSWVQDQQIYWNEQYLLAALLLHSKDWKVLAANHWLGRTCENEMRQLFPDVPVPGGGSFWMVKKGG